METLGSPSSHGAKLPKPQVRDAIDVLKNHSNSEILAWLAFARSIEPDFRHSSSTGCLPHKLVNAISFLRDWSNPAVLRLLQCARRNGAPESLRQDGLRPLTKTPGNLDPFSITNEVCRGLSPNPFRITKILESNRKHSRPFDTTRSRVRKHKPANTNYLYWCTICGPEDPHSFKRSDDWKRHEREHEIEFECLSSGKLDDLKEGDACVFCGKSGPDEEHFREHNVGPCRSASKGSTAFKRRRDMVSHLRDKHACTNSKALAEKWQSRSQKQAWSCGFCIALFTSLRERHKHIGMEHFGKLQSLRAWSSTKVIEGLLLQPEIREAWRAHLDTKDPFSRQNLSWDNEEMPDLQQRLELGVTSETAEELARATYELSQFDWVSHHTASEEANDPSTDFRVPPPIANRANISQKSWSPVSVTSIQDPTKFALPTAQSATRSWYSAGAINTPSLYTGASVSEQQSDIESIQGHSSETYHCDEHGLQVPFCDDTIKSSRDRSLESFLNDADRIIETDSFDGVATDLEQYDVGMQI